MIKFHCTHGVLGLQELARLAARSVLKSDLPPVFRLYKSVPSTEPGSMLAGMIFQSVSCFGIAYFVLGS